MHLQVNIPFVTWILWGTQLHSYHWQSAHGMQLEDFPCLCLDGTILLGVACGLKLAINIYIYIYYIYIWYNSHRRGFFPQCHCVQKITGPITQPKPLGQKRQSPKCEQTPGYVWIPLISPCSGGLQFIHFGSTAVRSVASWYLCHRLVRFTKDFEIGTSKANWSKEIGWCNLQNFGNVSPMYET